MGTRAWDHFPGVPAFFFFSGFLDLRVRIIKSPIRVWQILCESLPTTRYQRSICVTVGARRSFWRSSRLDPLTSGVERSACTWAGSSAQVTLGQAFNPAQTSGGSVSASSTVRLWTITVEILFYLAVPIIVLHGTPDWRSLSTRLFAASFAIYAERRRIGLATEFAGHSLFEYLSLTPGRVGLDVFFSGVLLCFKHFGQACIATRTLADWICAAFS